MSTTQTGIGVSEKIQNGPRLELNMRSWRPNAAPRGIVMIVPGFNAHSAQYADVAAKCVADGFAVYAIDLRGRGESDGERYFVEEFSDYVSDVRAMAEVIQSREATALPVFLLGHSAGGVVSCLYALDYQAELAGLVCESFAYQVPAPDFALAVFKGLSHVAPHAHVLKLRNEDFSRDPEVVAARNADPLIANETQPTQTMAAMVRADERLKQGFPQIHLPLLILHGTGDKATRPSGSQFFYDTAGSQDKTLKMYDGFYHDPLHDLGGEQVLADVMNWIRARLPR